MVSQTLVMAKQTCRCFWGCVSLCALCILQGAGFPVGLFRCSYLFTLLYKWAFGEIISSFFLNPFFFLFVFSFSWPEQEQFCLVLCHIFGEEHFKAAIVRHIYKQSYFPPERKKPCLCFCVALPALPSRVGTALVFVICNSFFFGLL